MSLIVTAIASVLTTSAIAVAVVTVVVVATLWEDVLEPILEFVLSLFGIEDEDIISTEVTTQRVISDEAENLITKITLEEQENEVGIIDRLMAYSQVARNKYSRYYNYGDDKFIDGLPDTNLHAIVVNNDLIKPIIDDKYGIDCTILESELGSINKEEYIGYYMQETYGYTPYNNEFTLNGWVYSINNIDYNYDNDWYDVYTSTKEDITTDVYTVTTDVYTVTVITITDNVQGTVELSGVADELTTQVFIDIWDSENTQIVTEEMVTLNGSDWIYDVSGLDDDDYTYTITEKDSEDNIITTIDSSFTVNNYANKNTLITERTVVTGSVRGEISDTLITVSDIDEDILVGSETNSTNTDYNSSTETDVVFDTKQYTVDAYAPVRYYIVKYYTTDSGEWLYWIYENGEGTYPTLDEQNKYITNLEMMPIVTIRNGTTNVNSNKESDRYKQSKDMLKFLGLDIDTLTDSISENPNIENVEDTFIHFGLQPSDTSEVVSKSLYNMFNYIYEDESIKNDANEYAFTISEGPFNAATAWTAQDKSINTGVIGDKGFYTHTISGKNLVMKYQALEEQYITITITNLSLVTLVDREGLVGTVAKDVNEAGFFMPISYYFVDKLSPLEQHELFNKALLISSYAAEVQHLEWYETGAFGSLLKIVGIVLSVVTFGYSISLYGLATTLMYMAIAYGATLLLQIALESIDSKLLKALAMVAYVAMFMYIGYQGLPSDASMLTTTVTLFSSALTSLSTAISIHTEIEMQALEEEYSVFQEELEERTEEIDKAKEALTPYISVEEMAEIKALEPPPAYLYGPDALMYKAINIQYNYDSMFDYDAVIGDFYDKKLQLGFV